MEVLGAFLICFTVKFPRWVATVAAVVAVVVAAASVAAASVAVAVRINTTGVKKVQVMLQMQ